MIAQPSRVARPLIRLAAACLLVLTGCGDPAGPPADLPDQWISVASGDYHTCALDTGGRAYCWGSNQFGQLGSDGVELSPWPQRVEGDLSFVALTSGFAHTCGLTAVGEAYCWGLGDRGQLGNGSSSNLYRPGRISGSWMLRSISAGHGHTCAITGDRRGLCWGDNTYGQLGTGTGELSRVPELVGEGGVEFFWVAAGRSHTCGAGSSGRSYCWGDNRQAQLGTAGLTPADLPVTVHTTHTFIRISAGFEATCGVTVSGEALCWGSNEHGALGVPGVERSGNPVPVEGVTTFNGISVGGAGHACGVSWTGRAYCWGEGGAGQLGIGATTGTTVPVELVTDRVFTMVTTGLRHSCGLTVESGIYCWGRGNTGQLGNGSYDDRLEPTRVGSSSGAG